MITRLKIEGLFGRFDYDLVFKDRVTILTGPNGFGKSTVLRMIEALGNGNVGFFFNLVYTSVQIEFDDGESVLIERKSDLVMFQQLEVTQNEFAAFEENLEFPFRITPEGEERISLNFYPLSGETKKALVKFYGAKIVRLFDIFYKISICLGSAIKRIAEQRMLEKGYENGDLGFPEPALIDTICLYPNKLKLKINQVTNVFIDKSSKIDSDFPRRLFSNGDEITEGQYNDSLEKLNEKFKKLEGYNLMTDRQDTQPFQPKHAAALKVYFDTTFEKYAVYDAFLEKLDLFVGIVNNRLMFKKLEISREKGFEVIDENTKAPLSLKNLSSGEKQVIVMYYDLIFNDNENLLLLIDEPEISMHVSWQSQFMEDLIRIAEHGNFRAIVATHSPDIINGLWDLQIDLGEQYQGNLYGEDEGESHGD